MWEWNPQNAQLEEKKHNIYATMVLFLPSLVTFEVFVMRTDLQSMLMYATAMKGRSRSL